jgi:hypothetical protein
MAFSDRIKVGILAMGYVICLATVWTAPSITMGDASMRRITPPIRQLCKAPQIAANQCHSGPGCRALKADTVKCQQTAREAYRYINLGGCSMEIKALTLCEAEWCQDHSACLSECAGVRHSLQTCKETIVASYFERHSLEKDGTAKIY